MFTLLLTFLRGNILQVAFAAVLAASVATAYFYKAAYVKTEKAYAQHLVADKTAEEIALAQKNFNEMTAEKFADEQVKKHKAEKARLALDNQILKKKIGELYAVKTNADFRIASYRDRLLLNTNSGDPTTDTASDPERIAACRRELNATDSRLSTVEEACAVTTSDYNLAKGWIDSVCKVHECKDKK